MTHSITFQRSHGIHALPAMALNTTGIGDCVRCHYCGLGLKDWDPEDRAMDEHVRWRSSCGYLQAVLGEYFIAKTLARLGQRGQGDASARSETSESVAAGLASHTTGVGERTATDPRADNSGITTEVDTLMTSQPAQEARAMGFPDDVIRQSIVALLHTRAGRNAITGRNVVHTILYLRERGQVPEVTEPPAEPSVSETNNDNNEDDNEDNTSRSTSANSSPQGRTLPRSPAPSVRDKAPAAQSAVSQVGSGQHLQVYQVTMQHGASQNSLQSSGSSSSSSSSFSSSSSGSSSSGSSWSSGDSGFASGSSSEDESSNGRGAQRPSSGPSTRRLPTITEGDVTREDLRRLEQENLELMERRRCKICLDNDISILFLPCGHLVCCGECAPALRRCPMCRKRITGTVHTKLAGLPSSTNPQGPG